MTLAGSQRHLCVTQTDILPGIEWGSLWCGSVVMLSLRLVGAAIECILGVICIRSCVPQARRKC